MALWHNRQPNPEMNNPPDKAKRDQRKAGREERKTDRVSDARREQIRREREEGR